MNTLCLFFALIVGVGRRYPALGSSAMNTVRSLLDAEGVSGPSGILNFLLLA
jgi:hypothetical protein